MRKLLIVFMIGCLATAAFAARPAGAPRRARQPRIDPTYTIHYAKIKPEFAGDWEAYWNSPAWKQAGAINVDQWTKDSSETRPRTQVKVLYDETGLRILWRVDKDPFLVCNSTKFMDPVSHDSCVEFFFEPSKDKGYINLETNACGVFLWRVQGWPAGLDIDTSYTAMKALNKSYERKEVTPEIGNKVQVRKSLTEATIAKPVTTPTTWYLESFFPIELLESSWGIKAADLPGANWRANFYKILDGTPAEIAAHNHYGAWSNIGPVTNFHQPAMFGRLRFEKVGESKVPETKAPEAKASM